MVKISFGKKATTGDGASAASPVAASPSTEQPPAPSRQPSMKISFKPQTPATESAPSLPSPEAMTKPKKGPKPKNKDAPTPGTERAPTILKLGTGKKRSHDDLGNADEESGTLSKKRAIKPTERAQSISFKVPNRPIVKTPTLKLNTKVSAAASAQPSGVKLKFGAAPSASAGPHSATTPLIKLKTRGKVPKRDPGVGYDSEDEDAEADPVLESHFILRMAPGDDCAYLRSAIAESGLKHRADGTRPPGPDVWFKFFDKEGRRGIVCVRGRMYAASLLDLPCIVETQKSWDRKGWYKTADVCQMLLVLGRIGEEAEARNYPLPGEVDRENWQFPHGLTPPMQWVRRRRFRKRVNRRHIERVEADVEELLKRDRDWEADAAGESEIKMEWVDAEEEMGEGEGEGDYGDEDMDAEGEMEDELHFVPAGEGENGDVYLEEPEAMEVEGDDDALAAELEAQMMSGFNDEEEHEHDAEGEVEAEGGVKVDHSGTATLIADSQIMQASPDTLHAPLDSAVTPASGVATSATEGSDDDDDDEPASDEEDEEEKARKEEEAQIRAEVRALEDDIKGQMALYTKQQNPLLKNKIKGRLDKLKADLSVKKSSLGEEDDEEGGYE